MYFAVPHITKPIITPQISHHDTLTTPRTLIQFLVMFFLLFSPFLRSLHLSLHLHRWLRRRARIRLRHRKRAPLFILRVFLGCILRILLLSWRRRLGHTKFIKLDELVSSRIITYAWMSVLGVVKPESPRRLCIWCGVSHEWATSYRYLRERRPPVPHRLLASSSVVGGDSYSRNNLPDLSCELQRVWRPNW